MKKRNFVKWVRDHNDDIMSDVLIILLCISYVKKIFWLGTLGGFCFITNFGIYSMHTIYFGDYWYRIPGQLFEEKRRDLQTLKTVKVERFRGLFAYAHFDPDRVPVIAVTQMKTIIGGAIVAGIFLLVFLVKNKVAYINVAGDALGLWMIYAGCFFMVDAYYRLKVEHTLFVRKYKRLSLGNIMYFLRQCWRKGKWKSRSFNEPKVSVLGKCRIISTRVSGKKRYAKVQMLKSEIVYNKVLLCDEQKQGDNLILKEIAGVKFMD